MIKKLQALRQKEISVSSGELKDLGYIQYEQECFLVLLNYAK